MNRIDSIKEKLPNLREDYLFDDWQELVNDVEYLLNEVERYKTALEKIANYDDDSRPCYPLYRIADEALEGK